MCVVCVWVGVGVPTIPGILLKNTLHLFELLYSRVKLWRN